MDLVNSPNWVYSFKPIVDRQSRLIVLGSMPGVRSLTAGQYYAHPHNAFWRIMATLLGFDPDADYADKVVALQTAGIALWDVLQACQREGSLDASIAADSQVANDFKALFRDYPQIQTVCFNGAKAEVYFKRAILPTLAASERRYIRLPSTSPAHAAMTFSAKLAAWQQAIRPDGVVLD